MSSHKNTYLIIHNLYLDTHLPRYVVKFQLIRKSARANLYAPEITPYSVPQRCCNSCCKNIPYWVMQCTIYKLAKNVCIG